MKIYHKNMLHPHIDNDKIKTGIDKGGNGYEKDIKCFVICRNINRLL